MNNRYAHIIGWGKSIPDRVVTNNELASEAKTSSQWIQQRTGICQRHIADPKQTTASLGAQAAENALSVAGIDPKEIDLIILATSSPDHLLPASACIVQHQIGARNAGAFDLMAACTGFVYALNMASQAIRSGFINNALVIGSDTLSRMVNKKDRNTCILFGDGAGAFVIQVSDKPGGFLSGMMEADGSGSNHLFIPAGGSCIPTSVDTIKNEQHYIQMNGTEIFRFATRGMVHAIQKVVDKAGLNLSDIKVVVPHQANKRIIETAARMVGIPISKFIVNVDRYGNTSTASIPIATCEAVDSGRLDEGDLVVFVGFGAGLTLGAVVVEWSIPKS